MFTFTVALVRIWSLDNPDTERHPDTFLDFGFKSTCVVALGFSDYVLSFIEPEPVVSLPNAAYFLALVIGGLYLHFVVMSVARRVWSALYCRLATRQRQFRA